MKTKLSTRFLSLLLCVLMCVSLLPVDVFAEEAENITTDFTEAVEETEPPVEEQEEDPSAETPTDEATETDPADDTPADQAAEQENPAPLAEDDQIQLEVDIVDSGICGANLTWTLDDAGTLTISGTGEMKDWTNASYDQWHSNRSSIKTAVIEDGVTSIGDYAFIGCGNLANVTVGSDITSIGQCAFSGCPIESISLPYGVTSIDTGAFSDCVNLKSITIPGSVTYLGSSWTFSGCTALTSITIPDGVGYIGNYVFSSCSSLKSVVIGNGVTSIGDNAFYGCSSLTDITIGNAVKSIGNAAFDSCAMTSIMLPASVTSVDLFAFISCHNLTSINVNEENAVFSSVDGVLFNKTNSELVIYPAGKTGEYVIPSGTLSIGELAFHNNSNLTKVTISGSVASISDSAFSYCSNLASMTISSGVTSIGKRAFESCGLSGDIIIPASVKSIGEQAFLNCSYLNSVTFCGDAPTLGYLIFKNDFLTVYYPEDNATWTDDIKNNYGGHITWVAKDMENSGSSDTSGKFGSNNCLSWQLTPDGVLTISGTGTMPDWASSNAVPWYSYEADIKTVVINSGVTGIGSYAFAHCTQLTDVTIPESVTGVGSSAFAWCTGLKNIELPAGVTRIGAGAFGGCSALTEIAIPSGVTVIYTETFSGCSALTSVMIPDGVTNIGDFAFSKCTALKSVTIPESVKTIGDEAFYNCKTLTICGIEGSYAEAYAKAHDIPFMVDFSFELSDMKGTAYESANIEVKSENGTIGWMEYSDNFFVDRTPEVYHGDLAEISLGAAISAYSNGKVTPDTTSEADASKNIRAFFDNIGIDDATIYTRKFNNNQDTTNDTAAFAMGAKCIGQNANGDIYLVPIIIRSCTYGGEWASNFRVVQDDYANYSAGFVKAAEDIYKTVDSYLEHLTDLGVSKDNMRLWVCGFSRGAATANYLSVLLDDNSGVSSWNIFTYCFATPAVAHKSKITNNYRNIWNVINQQDIVPRVPLKEWGYGIYGQAKYLPTATTVSGYNKYLKIMKAYFYESMVCEGRTDKQYKVLSGQEIAIDLLLDYLDDIVPNADAYRDSGLQKAVAFLKSGIDMNKDLIFDGVLCAFLQTYYAECVEPIHDFSANYSNRSEIENSLAAIKVINQIDLKVSWSTLSVYLTLRNFLSNYVLRSEADVLGVNNLVFNFSKNYDNLALMISDCLQSGESSYLLMQHWPETYLAWMRTREEVLDTSDKDIFAAAGHRIKSVKCPVDVTVTDSDGNIVCSIVNETVDGSIENCLYAYVDGDEKYIYVPDDETYTITMTARESCAVSITSTDYDAENNRGETVAYVEEPMAAEEKFVMTDETVTTNSGTLTPDYTYYGEAPVQMNVTVLGNGTAYGAGEYNIADTVSLNAIAEEGSVFCGWYTADGACISTDEIYQYLIVEDTEIQAVFSESPEITLDREYLALQAGSKAQKITAAADPEILNQMIQWSVESEADPAIIFVDENGNIEPLSAGTAYAVASITLGDHVYMTRCRVDVTDAPVAEAIENNTSVIKVGLAQTSAAVNIYSTDYTELTIVPVLEQNIGLMEENSANTGAAVKCAEFTDAATAEYFDLQVKDDRTLQIVPKDGVPAAVQNGTRKPAKNYTSTIKITIAGRTEPYETPQLKLSVTAALPKLKAGAVKFNAYDAGNTQPLTFSGAAVTGLSFNGTAPAGLVLDGNAMTLSLATENAATKAGKLNLLATVEGYAMQVPVTVSYSFANKAPSLKLKSSSMTVLSGSTDQASTTFTVTPDVFTTGKYTVKLQSIYEGKTEVTNGNGLTVSVGSNSVAFTAPDATADGKAHTYTVYLAVVNGSTGAVTGKTAKITVKVLPAVTAAKPTTVKLTASARGSIDTAIPASPIKVTAKISNYHAGSGETYIYTVQQVQTKTKATTDVTDLFDITTENGVLTLTQASGAALPQGYTYNLYLSVDIDGDGRSDVVPRTVKLSVKWSNAAKVQASVTLKAKGSINPLRTDTSLAITPTFKNCYGYALTASDLVFTETVGKNSTPLTAEKNPFTVTTSNGTYVVALKSAGAANASATYSVAFNAQINGKTVTSRAVKLTLKAGKTLINQSATVVDLIRADKNDTAVIYLTAGDGLNPIASVIMDKSAAQFYSLTDLGNGYYAIGFKDSAVTEKTRSTTARLTVKLVGTPISDKGATVSVKINLVTVR